MPTMQALNALLLVFICSIRIDNVRGDCDQKVVDRIEAFWKPTRAPRVELKKLRGTATLVHASNLKALEHFKCVQTVIHEDGTSGTVIKTNQDGSTSNYTGSNFIVERPGVITWTDPDTGKDYWRYVIYYDEKVRVLGYYQCKPYSEAKPSVSVEVINRNLKKRNKVTKQSIKAAIKVLDDLKINDGKVMRSKDCLFYRWKISAE